MQCRDIFHPFFGRNTPSGPYCIFKRFRNIACFCEENRILRIRVVDDYEDTEFRTLSYIFKC